MTYQPPMDSFELAAERFEDQLNRDVRDQGFGSSKAAQRLIKSHLVATSELVTQNLEASSTGRQGAGIKDFLDAIRPLDPYVVALSAITVGISSVCSLMPLSRTMIQLGRHIEMEVWAGGLRGRDAKLAKRLEEVARKRNSSVKQRRQAVRSMAKKNGYEAAQWTDAMRTKAGGWLLDVLLQTPLFVRDVFTNDDGREMQCLTLTQEADAQAAELTRALIEAHPVPLPLLVPPRPWKDTTNTFDCNDRSYQLNLVRKNCKVTQRILKQASKDGHLQPTYDALNAIQATAWSINEPIRDLVVWCHENGVEVEGLPNKEPIEMPPAISDEAWNALSDDQKRLRRREIGKKKEINRTLNGERKTFIRDIATADHILERGNRFWTPYNMDYRGRVYSTCHFGFQRQDYVRALFKFAEGKPLGERGLYWLGIHLANCGDFEKVSKKPFEVRDQWVQDNQDLIWDAALHPEEVLKQWVKETKAADGKWQGADSPFLFMAACREYIDAFYHPTTYVCNLPVSFDGSCSGLQHLAAMTLCETTASLVNVKPSSRPQDVYQTVADKVKVKVQGIAEDASNDWNAAARLALDYGITRSLTKRNVMTYSYSSPKFGMMQQQMEDTMRPLSDDITKGKIQVHPFEVPADTFKNKEGKTVNVPGKQASKLLGSVVFDTIEETVEKPAEAMVFLQKIAKALAHEGKHTQWTTPMGFPVVLRYPNVNTTRVSLYLSDQGQNVRLNVNLNEEAPGIDKAASARAVAPSFVHSYDACHLQMVALKAAKSGIKSQAYVHDSFGCLPSDAEEFREIIRKEFYWLYSYHDVLASIHQEACDQIETNYHRLPELPSKGSLNIEEVLDAEYAFA